jgi:DNA polymerase IV (DinB-like DNA polymerase)
MVYEKNNFFKLSILFVFYGSYYCSCGYGLFFCACEVKRNSELKGKCVIVGSTSNRGVVSASSYEARKFGVFSAMPIVKAKELCPNGIYLPVDKKFYYDESKKIMSIFEDISDDYEQVSVDEAYLDLTNLSSKFNSLEELGNYVKALVFEKTGLTCSIGISNSRRVSKIASDFNKPNGVTIVSDAKEFLSNLDIKKIPGIGKVSLSKYYDNEIYKIGDLAKLDKFKVLDLFGMHGIEFQNIALGLDFSGLSKKDVSKSFSREDTYEMDISDVDILKETLISVSRRVYQDLGSIYFQTISIKIKYSDFKSITRDITLKTPSNDSRIIMDNALMLFDSCYELNRKVRLLGVKVSKLSSINDEQMTLNEF